MLMKRTAAACAICWIILLSGVLTLYNFGKNLAVEMEPPAITGISCADGAVTLEWNAVDYATSYRVYRRPKDGAWELLGAVGNNVHSYTDELSKNIPDIYAVRSCNVSLGNVNLSSYSSVSLPEGEG